MDRDPVGAAPPSAVAIRAAVDWMRGHRGAVVAGALALVVLASVASGLYAVGNGESAALRRFGALVDDNVGPGLHVRIPWGVDTVATEQTGGVFRLEVRGDVSPQLSLVSGDENIIEIVLVVQYKITRLGDYLFRADNPVELVTQAVRAALVDAVARAPIDDVLTAGKAQIQHDVRARAQSMLHAYGTGLTLVAVNLQSVTPLIEAAQAFREVNDAKAEAARAVNDAQSKRERALALARGEAEQLLAGARAGAAGRVQQARGATDRFRVLLARKQSLPAHTMTDLYTDTVRKVLPRAKVVVLAPGQKPRIDLNLIERRPAANGSAAPPVPPP